MASIRFPEEKSGFGECGFNEDIGEQALQQSVVGVGSNVPAGTRFDHVRSCWCRQQAIANSWKEYRSGTGDKKPYWHNEVLGVTTWDKPDTNGEKKPPPPPSPPKKPSLDKDNPGNDGGNKTEEESDHWKQSRTSKGRKYWYNEKTRQSQYDTPNCLRKYRLQWDSRNSFSTTTC